MEAQKIFINTGARPFVPPIPGLQESEYVYLSEGMLMELRELPRRLVVIGGGYIGVEFASIYANFRLAGDHGAGRRSVLPREDAEVAAEVLKSLESRACGCCAVQGWKLWRTGRPGPGRR